MARRTPRPGKPDLELVGEAKAKLEEVSPPEAGPPTLSDDEANVLRVNGYVAIRQLTAGVLNPLRTLPVEAIDAAASFVRTQRARPEAENDGTAADNMDAELKELEALRRWRVELDELDEAKARRASLRVR